jgi:hypothetical protein
MTDDDEVIRATAISLRPGVSAREERVAKCQASLGVASEKDPDTRPAFISSKR